MESMRRMLLAALCAVLMSLVPMFGQGPTLVGGVDGCIPVKGHRMNKSCDERANAPSSGPSSSLKCGERKSQHGAKIREKAMNRDAAVPRCFVAAVAVLIVAQPAVAGDALQWGSTVNGLKMSVALSIDSIKNGDIRVTLQNLGDKDILIPLGMIVGKPQPTLLKTTLKRSEEHTSEL